MYLDVNNSSGFQTKTFPAYLEIFTLNIVLAI